MAVVALTRQGCATAQRLARGWEGLVTLVLPPRWAVAGGRLLDQPLRQLLPQLWVEFDHLVLVMATGVAVRQVAPLLADKVSDPGVVVVDELGRYAISLVGGHLGGANALAYRIAGVLEATPVITTASDGQGLPSLDLLARHWGLRPEPREALIQVSAALVNGDPVNFYADQGWTELRQALAAAGEQVSIMPLACLPEQPAAGLREVVISYRQLPGSPGRLYLRPPEVVVGVGCRRGIAAAAILAAVDAALAMAGVARSSLARLATVDLKADEIGLLAAARHLGLPLEYYARQQLQNTCERRQLTASEVVRRGIGVDGVCEPAALQRADANLILAKQRFPGVALALAVEPWRWWELDQVDRNT